MVWGTSLPGFKTEKVPLSAAELFFRRNGSKNVFKSKFSISEHNQVPKFLLA
jgi:hypothetical protein